MQAERGHAGGTPGAATADSAPRVGGSSGSGGKVARDPRVDVLRGAALLMIFIDHIPGNDLSWFTMHVFGFCDAAEVFVMLAGFAAMIAYGRSFAREGVASGLRKVGMRCLRIYLTQIGLLLITLIVVQIWTSRAHLVPLAEAPVLNAGLHGIRQGLLLHALPEYLDILPLYIVLLGVFPLLYWVARQSLTLLLLGSAAVWLAALYLPGLDLPRWPDNDGWYFDPFSWQFLFTIGIAHAVILQRLGHLPRRRWLVAAAALFLLFAFLQTAPFNIWHLPSLRLFPMPTPDKSRLAALRIIDMVALFYLVMTSAAAHRAAASRWLRPMEACGRHSLFIFATGCVLALVGRLAYRTLGFDWPMQVSVNAIGIAIQCGVGMWLERSRQRRAQPEAKQALHPAGLRA